MNKLLAAAVCIAVIVVALFILAVPKALQGLNAQQNMNTQTRSGDNEIFDIELSVAPQFPEEQQPVSIVATATGSALANSDMILDFGDRTNETLLLKSNSASVVHAYETEGQYTIAATLGSKTKTAAVTIRRQTMHAGCKLEQCVLVAGKGIYTCSADADCAGITGLGNGTNDGTGSGSGSGGSGTNSGANPIPSVTGDIAVIDVLIAHGDIVNNTVDVAVNALLENYGSEPLAAVARASITYDGVFEESADIWIDLAAGRSQNVYLGTKTLSTGIHDITVSVSIDNFVDTNPQNNMLTERFDVR